jgi:hypothetical protein
MAIGIVEVLGRHGRIDQDDLATVFARRFPAGRTDAADRGAAARIEGFFWYWYRQ